MEIPTEKVKKWLESAKEKGATHLLHVDAPPDNYPVEAKSIEDVQFVGTAYHCPEMGSRVIAVWEVASESNILADFRPGGRYSRDVGVKTEAARAARDINDGNAQDTT